VRGQGIPEDTKSYQRLLDLAERLETIHAVREGLSSIDSCEGKPMDQVFDQLENNLRAKARS